MENNVIMTPNLQVVLRRFISSNIVSKLNKFYFENDTSLIKAIDISLGIVLMGLYKQIEEPAFFDEIVKKIEEPTFYEEVDFETGKILSVDDCYAKEGNPILKLIFANKKEKISEMISNEIGIKIETARELLSFSALLVASYLKNNLQLLPNLKFLLENQKEAILNTISLKIKVILGFSCLESVQEKKQINLGKPFFMLFGHPFFYDSFFFKI